MMHDDRQPIEPLQLTARSIREVVKRFGLLLDHYGRLHTILGKANVIKVSFGGPKLPDVSARYQRSVSAKNSNNVKEKQILFLRLSQSF